ncbi:MAG TPA: Do family serine endopeptidase [Dongiaceae bacterium]|nr:Do family serine endopeptidase [Dongiaceae bacterium]
MNTDPGRRISPRTYYLSGVALLLVGVVVGLGLSARFDLQGTSRAARNDATVAAVAVQNSPTRTAPVPESPFVSVVDRALPAVVFVDVRKKAGSSDDGSDEIFRFFGDNPHRQQQRVPSSGSGFIIDPKGYILTNNHVVRDADEINVTLEDKRTFKAKVVGTDPETDVAVIKIEGDHLPTLPLGDSDAMRVGDWAIAIGNPLGMLKGSVTVGIVSALARTDLNIFGGTPQYQDFIQTDASINFGNSGGPLCNIRGEAIGINTAINPSGQGIGFAIPMNLAKHVADQLIAHGTVQRAWLGVRLAEVTPEIAEGFGLKSTDGALISEVMPGRPAERAGLRRNDVIVEFDGQPVTDWQKFRLKVADMPVGRTVPLVVLRDGKRVNLSVTLGARDAEVASANGTNPAPATPPTTESLAGLTVRDLTADEKQESGAKNGVLVTDVQDGSAAEEAGLSANMIIEELGGKPVANAAAFTRMIKDAKTKSRYAVLLVRAGQQTTFVPLQVRE